MNDALVTGESLSMHVQVDGIEFNHRNDRPFFFSGGVEGLEHELWGGGGSRLHERLVVTKGLGD